MNDETILDRHDFFEQNKEELIQKMKQSGMTDPVGLLLDVRDHHARQFAIALGMSETDLDAFIARHEGISIPTIKSVITWEVAIKLMPFTSPTALRTLQSSRRVCNLTGEELVIVIAAGGNAYRTVALPKTPASVQN